MSTIISGSNSFSPIQPSGNPVAGDAQTPGSAVVAGTASLPTDASEVMRSKALLSDAGGNVVSKMDDPLSAPETRSALVGLSSFSDSQVAADIYDFMALFQKMAQEMRNTARTQRTTEGQAQTTALLNAADKMKEAAGQRFTAAVVQGAFQIASGAVQAGMSFNSARNTIKGAQQTMRGNNLQAKIDVAKESNPASNVLRQSERANGMIRDGKVSAALGEKWSGYSQGASGGLGGMGGIIAAGFNQKADLLDAEKANLDAQASLSDTAVQHANDLMQQMMEVIRDVRDKMASMEQSQVETTRGIARNI